MRSICAVLAFVLFSAAPNVAQSQSETLGDIRQELSVLFVEIQRLKSELNTTGSPSISVGGGALQRLDAIERQLQVLTGKTEQLEFRIEQVVADGTNRVSDLEFRLCELETGCDIGDLTDTPTLGGVSTGATQPTVAPSTTGPELAMSESGDFERAKTKLANGDSAGASIDFSTFLETYPGSPLTYEVQYYLGEALEAQSQNKAAARAFLNSFSGDPQGALAPDALFRIGVNLEALGQVADACSMWSELGLRYPNASAVIQAQAAQRNAGCQ